MLSGVVALLLVVVLEAIEAGVGQSLVVVTPADALVVEKVYNGGDVLVDDEEAVAVQPKGITAGGRDVVGLAGGANPVLVGQKGALLVERLAISYCEMLALSSAMEHEYSRFAMASS